ncbi:hypothetical protein DPMN_001419 [Dreissena polymorpha]|uniref:Uncharacterized protein n=1 Tax=Dreissena polymorpha TaxID=45954 RepID=A0A9D4RSW4_DREPO|nr:hypothetical protein DPMN_001419 [Dreissena polymorpha]
MESILNKLGLQKYVNILSEEKISPDIICDMSLYDMACLGLNNRAEIMNLRTACIHFGNSQVRRDIGSNGGPSRSTFQISKQTLEGLIESDFEVKEIAELLSVSESTVYRRMRMYELKN